MFKSSGYFKGVNCPYFSSGLCERTYCHFRHVKPDSAREYGIETENSSLDGARHLPGAPQTSVFQKLESVKWYKPTPIPKPLQNRSRHGQSPAVNKQVVPEYNPTPLHVLKKGQFQSNKARENVSTGPEQSRNAPQYKPTVVSSVPPLASKGNGNLSTDQRRCKIEPLQQNSDENDCYDPLQGSESAKVPRYDPTPRISPVTVQTKINESCGEPKPINKSKDTSRRQRSSITNIKKEIEIINLIEAQFPDDDKVIEAQFCDDDKLIEAQFSDKDFCKRKSSDKSSSEVTDTKTDKGYINIKQEQSANVHKSNPETSCSLAGNSTSDINRVPGVKTEPCENSKTAKENDIEDIDADVIVIEKNEAVEVITLDSECEEQDKSQPHKSEKSRHSSSSNKDHKAKKSYSHSHGKSSSNSHKSRDKHKSSRSSKDRKSDEKHSSRSKSSHSSKNKKKHDKKRRSESSPSSSSSSRSSKSHSKSKQSSTSHTSKHEKHSSRHKSSSRKSSHKRHRHSRSSSSSRSRSRSRRKDKVHVKQEKGPVVKNHVKDVRSEAEKKATFESSGAQIKDKNIFDAMMSVKVEKTKDACETLQTEPNLADNKCIENQKDSSKTKDPKLKSKGSVGHQKPTFQKLASCAELFGEDSDSDTSPTKSRKSESKTKSKSNREKSKSFESAKKGVIHLKLLKERDSDSSSIMLSASDEDTSDNLLNGYIDSPEKTTRNHDKDEKTETEIPDSVLADLEHAMSDEDPFSECFEIFNEAKSKAAEAAIKRQQQLQAQKRKSSSEGESAVVLGKVRKARATESDFKTSLQRRIAGARPGAQISPAQVMHNRLMAMQQRAERKRSSESDQSSSTNQKKPRLAHQPSMVPRTSQVVTKQIAPKEEKKDVTPCGTVSKFGIKGLGNKRQAHIPAVVKKISIPRPTVPAEFGAKIPSNVRQVYLNKIIDECLKIYPAEQDAYDRAMAEEKEVYNRSGTKKIYLNVAVNCIAKLRQEASPKSPGTSPSKNPRLMSHQAVLGGAKALTNHYTIKRSATVNYNKNLTVPEFYERLRQYILAEQEQVENGYPRQDPNKPKHAIICTDDERTKNSITSNKLERLCRRCGKRFRIESNGQYIKHESCTYHWGKSFKKRITKGVFENKWTCCGGDFSTKGCQVAGAHVHEQNKYEDLTGYVRMLESSKTPLDGNYGVYALDCEMVYTTVGMEIARVTVVDMNGDAVLEQLILPYNPVLDYNTRFSGISESDMKKVAITLRDVHAMLMGLFNNKTILIGHSLESDLIALKMFHDNVVDTSVVFPHRLGRPYKRALKTLMAEILQRIIQEDVGGHDSLEDAVSCMDLMKWKVKEDIKKEMRQIAQTH